MRDEIMEMIYLVVLTALIISLGYVAVLNERKDTEQYVAELMGDKNVGLIESLILPAYGEYDGTLSKGDVILMSQIQDYYMPLPKTIKVEDGGELEITSVIEGNLASYGHQMIQYVNASGGTKFNIEYDNGDDLSTEEDDYFFIKKAR